jgi:hypothetical protein
MYLMEDAAPHFSAIVTNESITERTCQPTIKLAAGCGNVSKQACKHRHRDDLLLVTYNEPSLTNI